MHVWLGTFNTTEEVARAYDAEARKIRGKKAKVNFPDEAPRASPKPSVKAKPQKPLPRTNLTENLGYLNNPKQDYFNTMGFLDEKPLVNQFSPMGSFPCNGDAGVKSNVPAYFNSDQGSNSFDCSDFGWGDHASKTPEISSVLSATPEIDESLFMEDANPKKRMKSDSGNAVPVENNEKSLSEELLAYDNQMNFQMPYLEGNWETSLDSLLNGDTTQDGANPMDLWSFDDGFPSLVGGVY